MTRSITLVAAGLALAFTLAACEKDTPVESAVENTKDALDIRDHEKLKDAGEDAKDAVKEAGEGVKDAVDGK